MSPDTNLMIIFQKQSAPVTFFMQHQTFLQSHLEICVFGRSQLALPLTCFAAVFLRMVFGYMRIGRSQLVCTPLRLTARPSQKLVLLSFEKQAFHALQSYLPGPSRSPQSGF